MLRQLIEYFRSGRATWIEPGRLVACRYPKDQHLRDLADGGIKVVINLYADPHPQAILNELGLEQVHVPVADFDVPNAEQVQLVVNNITNALAAERPVAVHCGGGLGRTGTMLACYQVTLGAAPDEAIAALRKLRPGSVETKEQEQFVRDFAARRLSAGDTG